MTHIADVRIKYKVDDPIFTRHDYGLDLAANSIDLMGSEAYISADSEKEEPGVEFAMANRFIKNLTILMRYSDKPILILMKSCGGDWTEGMAIHNAIEACPNKVTILNFTHARSMSSLILQAADRRVMMRDSTFMFHGGDQSFSGTHKQFMTEAAEAVKSQSRMLDIYVESMKATGKGWKSKSKKAIRSWLEHQMNLKEEVYFDAEQAVKHGFADQVFGAGGVYDWAALVEFED